MAQSSSIKIPPFYYIHVLDCNTNVTRLEIGPQTFIRQDNEKISSGDQPLKMLVIPPRNYCEIADPVVRSGKDRKVQFDKYGQAVIQHGEFEIRLYEQYSEPFPLYPSERVQKQPTPLKVVQQNKALKLEALRDFVDNEGKQVRAGEEWLFIGQNTYYPRVEVLVKEEISAYIIGEQRALKLRATRDLIDSNGISRKTGEEWLVRKPGPYLPSVYEQVVQINEAYIITSQFALHLRASKNFIDEYGLERKAGEEWLITEDMASHHILDIYEEYVALVERMVLNQREYCVVLDPVDPKTGNNKLGAKELRKGEISFFLKPGESLEDDVLKDVYILSAEEALLLRAKEHFVIEREDGNGNIREEHQPGDRWMEYGPCTYIPPVEVDVLEKRQRIPLDKNEGIYVRDTRSGLIKTVMGEAYMLEPHEELYSLDLPEQVEDLLAANTTYPNQKRDKTRVVTYRCPFNTAVQVYDYKSKTSRVVFGPNLVVLSPDEQFTVTVLSGKTPKIPGIVKTLYVNMGPEFSTDDIVVETTDHARLSLKLSYNWHFRVINKEDQVEASSVFNVRDFIGDMCNTMAAKIRSAVASVPFESFHKSSAKLIRKSIFGVNVEGKIGNEFVFHQNNLIITNVDIQSITPVDNNTRLSLQKSVTLAIERTTKNQEDKATRQAEKQEQEARGELERQAIEDQAKAEELKKKLLQLKAESEEVRNSGIAIADAQGKAEAEEIQANSRVTLAQYRAQAQKIEREAQIEAKISKQDNELQFQEEMAQLEIHRSKELAEIESQKYRDMIDAIGQETLVAISQAGPESQIQLLKALGLNGFIMTDGNNPINLFNASQGLIGGNQSGGNNLLD